MPGPIGGRSPSRQMTQTQTTQKQQPQTTQRGTQQPVQSQSNPHLSNPHTAIPDRNDIEAQTKKFPSSYGSAVSWVNGHLKAPPMGIAPFGISSHSKQSVMSNLEGVHNGTMTMGQAHRNESKTFFNDGMADLKAGNYKPAGMQFAGSALNFGGSVAYEGISGLGNTSRPTSGNSGTFD